MTDLDFLAELTRRPHDVSESERVLALSFLSGIAQRVPQMTPGQRRNTGHVVRSYCESAARDLPPERRAAYAELGRRLRDALKEH
jgi:hypothetical protein